MKQIAGQFMVGYRADIDGLRALAVLAVVLNHGKFGVPGGFVGVDVFFVISGFVICRQLAEQIPEDRFHWNQFLMRRIRRILPLQLVVTAVCLLVSWLLLLPGEFQRVAEASLSQCLLAVNLYFYRTVDYFGNAAKSQPLLHCWSLSVEEQFYLFLPACLLLMYRRIASGRVALMILVGTFGSLLCSELMVRRMPWGAWYLHPSRTWELLLGCLLALRPLQCSSRICRLLDLIGAASICSSLFLLSGQSRFPGAAALWPCLGTALVIVANNGPLQFFGRALATRPFVFVGKISYSVYLWHWPLLVFLSPFRFEPAWSRCIDRAYLPVLLLISWLSWRYLEEPARRHWLTGRNRTFVLRIASVWALLLVVSAGLAYWDPTPSHVGQAASIAAARDSFRFIREVDAEAVSSERIPSVGCSEELVTGEWAVWGDSHAMALLPAVEALAQEQRRKCWVLTHSQTAPAVSLWKSGLVYGLREKTEAFNTAVRRFLKARQVELVIISCVWGDYTSEQPQKFEQELDLTVSALVQSGTRVVLVRDVARQDVDVPAALSLYVRLGWPTDSLGRAMRDHRDENGGREEMLEKIAQRYLGSVVVVDPAAVLVDAQGVWRMELDGEPLYRDDNHLTENGAMRLRPLFYDAVQRLQSTSRQLPGSSDGERRDAEAGNP